MLPFAFKRLHVLVTGILVPAIVVDDNFRPEYAVDDNNGTLWRPRGMGQEWLEIDLGRSQQIQTIWTQFEYGTQFYQYLIETSTDGKRWTIFAARTP